MRQRGSAYPRRPEARTRIVALTRSIEPRGRGVVYSRETCDECSVGSREAPIPNYHKRLAEFRIHVGKNISVYLCRGCALQFAEDFASQLEVLTEG